MYDENFFFSFFFFVFSYKLLFWSDRHLSLSTLLLTVTCALSLTQMIYPLAHRVLFQRVMETVQDAKPDNLSFRDLADGAWKGAWNYADRLYAFTHK
tara:strand:- start:173 stop:463 length:291 start_codon:yes stop_codon:yes gene_type:complete